MELFQTIKSFLFSNPDQIINLFTSFTIKLLQAGFILMVGWWSAKKLAVMAILAMKKREIDLSLQFFFKSALMFLIRAMSVLMAISTLGFQTASLLTVIGGFTIGIGMALQGSLSNFAGGILILIFKPFKVNDYIEHNGHAGFVERIEILSTSIRTNDNKNIILPNAMIYNNVLINYSRKGVIRVQTHVGIAYQDSFSDVKNILLDALNQDPVILNEYPVTVDIDGFSDSSVTLAIRSFAKLEDHWSLKFKMNEIIKSALEKNGYSIPYPQREYRIVQPNKD